MDKTKRKKIEKSGNKEKKEYTESLIIQEKERDKKRKRKQSNRQERSKRGHRMRNKIKKVLARKKKERITV